tara:strand:+ start:226 stop:396 length:171 start_codon:yes stop_codon:yes gene_type:complete
MPSQGEYQQPAGVKLKCNRPLPGTRVMRSNNTTIMPILRQIDNVPYKGNAVLNANS